MTGLKTYSLYIGIDPGTETGFSVWDKKARKFLCIKTVTMAEGISDVLTYFAKWDGDVLVRIEDARKRKWFGGRSEQQRMGAGSIKRECAIWEELLKLNHIPYELVHPGKGITKLKADAFTRITKYTGRTSSHARDAAMLVFDR